MLMGKRLILQYIVILNSFYERQFLIANEWKKIFDNVHGTNILKIVSDFLLLFPNFLL